MTDENRKARIQEELARSRSNLESARLLASAGRLAEAVSLAYYAGFHAVRALLASRGLQPKSHQGLFHLFNVQFVVPGTIDARLLALLQRAQQSRIRADYETGTRVDAEDAAREIQAAEQLLAGAENLLATT